MKRDMELIRLLLWQLEEKTDKAELDITTFSTEEVLYHKSLLINAKLVEGTVLDGIDEIPADVQFNKLTWEGHEFADAARNEAAWKKVMSKLSNEGVSITFSVVKELIMSEVKRNIGI